MSLAQSAAAPGFGLRAEAQFSHNPWLLPWLARGGLIPWVVGNVLVALLYAGLGVLVGRFFGAYGLFPAPIWLPAGIACVAAMVGGAGLLPGIFIGSCLVNGLFFGSSPGLTLAISLGNTLGPWAGMMVTQAMRPLTGLFTRFIGVLGFILGGVLLHAACTAAIGTLALSLASPMSLAEAYAVFSAWWLCDSGGTFFFAPALLLWLGAERSSAPADRPPGPIDTLVLLGTVAAVAALFAIPGTGRLVRPDAVFLLTVPLSWITLRISLRAAYTLLTLICLAATVGTVLGEGPFQGPAVANPLQSVGLMTVLFAMDALTLIALTSEGREARARLAETRGTLARSMARTENLAREALTDPLTGAGNRRHFNHAGGAVLYKARQSGQPCSLIFFDIDHFKALNDAAGHEAGDAALRAVAKTTTGILREQTLLFRMGGEEFAVLLPCVALAEAAAVAERLRLAIRTIRVGEDHRLSASFGVTECGPSDRCLDHLLRRADAAVYAAKESGRDRVELAPPEA
ncbi:sensor domain-containing diguanylate cyclase [Belnapia rosea]|uniref:diguanylate cyclase n=1 Tax=Belnapia rosea TaxID=938405 RepID=A0A1G6VH35_9PROT|nr:diguanylate cyclase [Belnapia rosea]SDD52932.1 diguanylate cyclase (GGDEF) domain-containing protein [Belnapia rosea]